MGRRPAKADEDAATGVGQAVPPAILLQRAVGRRQRLPHVFDGAE